MDKVFSIITAFYTSLYERDENKDEGATVVEYALIVALISIAAVGVYVGLGTAITDAFQSALDAF